MKYTSANGRLIFEAEPSTQREAFELLAELQDVFEEAACGCCGSVALRYEVREYPGVTGQFYKLCCVDCRAQLDYGTHKDNKGLFPKRRDKAGADLPDRGWYVYQPPADPPKGQRAAEAAPVKAPPARPATPRPPETIGRDGARRLTALAVRKGVRLADYLEPFLGKHRPTEDLKVTDGRVLWQRLAALPDLKTNGVHAAAS